MFKWFKKEIDPTVKLIIDSLATDPDAWTLSETIATVYVDCKKNDQGAEIEGHYYNEWSN